MTHEPSFPDDTGDHPSRFVEIAVDLAISGTFTYRVPPALFSDVRTGCRVLVPFRNRTVTGYVLGDAPAPQGFSSKPIRSVQDEIPLFPSSLVPLFLWISDYYLYPLGKVIKTALPGGINIADTIEVRLSETRQPGTEAGVSQKQEMILKTLKKTGPCRMRDLEKAAGIKISSNTIQSLERKKRIHTARILEKPAVRKKTGRFISLVRKDIPKDRWFTKRIGILDLLEQSGDLPISELKKNIPDAGGFIPYLEKNGYVSIDERELYRDPFGDPIVPDLPPVLNDDQRNAVDRIAENPPGHFATYLLSGVTGSGKTEVYMHLAGHMIDHGMEVIVLVPEIALISQTERRFRARFGESVAVLHSGLSQGERYDQWLRIAKGETPIVIGARSAVFAPLKNPGLIIVDEEHDTSYKQESGLRYNARDMAVVRANIGKFTAVLGSATPSLQSFHNARIGKFTEITLTKRIRERPLPKVTIVDLTKKRDNQGSRRFITGELYQAMKETLARKEQVLLFLNRRGWATFPVCGACGESMRCPSCDLTLTLHRSTKSYRCHLCGFSRSASAHCTVCGSSAIKQLGFGSEKVEAAVADCFPEANIARLDRDTISRKGALPSILKKIRNRSVDIIVGTQMTAKGHDFPYITLVGILCADVGLSLPDFRAGERTFQILAQVAGRAGRGESSGRVILQTFNPNHFVIETACKQDVETFYRQETLSRKQLGYPPYSRMVRFGISSKDRDLAGESAVMIANIIKKELTRSCPPPGVIMLGPVEAPISRIMERYRMQLFLKGSNFTEIRRMLKIVIQDNRSILTNRKVRVEVDVDPYSML